MWCIKQYSILVFILGLYLVKCTITSTEPSTESSTDYIEDKKSVIDYDVQLLLKAFREKYDRLDELYEERLRFVSTANDLFNDEFTTNSRDESRDKGESDKINTLTDELVDIRTYNTPFLDDEAIFESEDEPNNDENENTLEGDESDNKDNIISDDLRDNMSNDSEIKYDKSKVEENNIDENNVPNIYITMYQDFKQINDKRKEHNLYTSEKQSEFSKTFTDFKARINKRFMECGCNVGNFNVNSEDQYQFCPIHNIISKVIILNDGPSNIGQTKSFRKQYESKSFRKQFVKCESCSNDYDNLDMVTLSCNHKHCKSCIGNKNIDNYFDNRKIKATKYNNAIKAFTCLSKNCANITKKLITNACVLCMSENHKNSEIIRLNCNHKLCINDFNKYWKKLAEENQEDSKFSFVCPHCGEKIAEIINNPPGHLEGINKIIKNES